MDATLDSEMINAMPMNAMPLWVPAVLVLLVLLGLRQARARTVRPAVLTAVAVAMFGLSGQGVVSAFGWAPAALALWALGYALALAVGTRWMRGSGLAVAGRLVHVPGSWVPLGLLLGIFTVKFVLGFAAGVHSPLLRDLGFMAATGAVLGALSGGFGARALAVQRVARSAVPT